MLFPKQITPQFFQVLDTLFPAAMTDKPLRSLLMYLAFGFSFGYTRNAKLIGQEVCAILEAKTKQFASSHYSAIVFLENARKTILPNLTWSNWRSEGFPRQVICDGFSDAFKLAIEAERIRLEANPPTVHYFTGRSRVQTQSALTKALARDTKQRLKISAHLTKQSGPLAPLQQRFLSFLNDRPRNSFTNIVATNYADAVSAANAIGDSQTRNVTLDMLRAIKTDPKPIYAAKGSTVRLFAIGPAMTYLKKEVRKQLTKGWIEFDLDNAHLAIAAKDWNVPDLTEILSKGKIWPIFQSVFPDVLTNPETKDHVKKGVYTLVYGGSRLGMKKRLTKTHGAEFAQTFVKTFFGIPIVKTIRAAARVELRRIKNDPNARIDCFNRSLAFDAAYPAKSARSILSQKAQAVELLLMQPMLDISETTSKACIMMVYQFDGFSVHIADHRRTHLVPIEIQKAMNGHITKLGYQTRASYDVLQ